MILRLVHTEKNIRLAQGKIVAITDREISPNEQESVLDLDNACAFPGLINSHDHLDFDLFPRLGNGVYNNYMEWGADIHRTNKDLIDPILKIPRPLRIQWGIYRNLLNGFSTVINHGKPLAIQNTPITVLQPPHFLHSVGLEKYWKLALNKFYKGKPSFIIHIGEGTDDYAAREIDRLIKWNIFRRDLIGIHGVAMSEKQASSFKALVWCPDSNFFLFNKTAAVDRLKEKTSIVFGSDSTLTASWNIWEQIRLARAQKMVNDAELWDMLTLTPAQIWGLQGCGEIKEGGKADLIIVKSPMKEMSWDWLYALNPDDMLLVLNKGEIRLFDQSLYDQLAKINFPLQEFYKVYPGKYAKYVFGDLPGLMKAIHSYHPKIAFPIT